jgi:N-acetylmuramoyl-L-alanine amidase
MQEENLNNSINLATKIQNNFTHNLERNSRGVKQQPLWVLDAVCMPSVLIELGFLSNVEEGGFLNSDAGQDKMAIQIAKAILSYKKEYLGEETRNSIKSESKEIPLVKNEVKEKLKTVPVYNETIYKVQLFAGSQKIQFNSSQFKGLKKISSTFNNNIYRYMYGETSNFDEATKLKIEAVKTGFAGAYIVVVKEGKSTAVNDIVNQ